MLTLKCKAGSGCRSVSSMASKAKAGLLGVIGFLVFLIPNYSAPPEFYGLLLVGGILAAVGEYYASLD